MHPEEFPAHLEVHTILQGAPELASLKLGWSVHMLQSHC